MRKIFIINALAFALLSTTTFAKTADELLASGTLEEQGYAIVKEADDRDFGFGGYEVSALMELKNAHGQTSTRQMRNRIFEMADASVGDKSMIIFDMPHDIRGSAFLTFSKILEADDQWMYLPKIGKVKRISSKNKSGPFMGSEFAYEDISSPEVGKFTYKYLGKEACDNGMECLMVERYPLYEHSGYTKEIVWYDTNEFRFWRVDSYDRKGALMKTMNIDGYKQYLNKYWRADVYEINNHQTKKSTILTWDNYDFKTGFKENDFRKSDLKNAR
ncbi:MAG: hypothetical protein ACI9TY_000144 [Alphaproteobacteria bacterium]|jgi:hypothetical protein